MVIASELHEINHTPGKHVWRVSGDFACSTQDQTISLSLRLVLLESGYLKLDTFNFLLFSSCSSEEFTCSDGVCIDLIKRSPFIFVGGGHCPLDRHKLTVLYLNSFDVASLFVVLGIN